MKKYLFSLIFLFVSFMGFSQKGISYQAVILAPNPIEAPGLDISGQPYVNGEVWIKFSIYGSTLQYEEVHKTKTDAYGLVNLMIGSVSAASFNSLVWDSAQKTLQVHVSFNQGGSYTKVSDQKLTYNPYSLYAETASKLGGTLAITGGGTGATTLSAARVNLGIDKVDNTSDLEKPVSAAMQAALDLKANKGDVPAATSTATASITDADATTKGKIQLAGDLGGTAAAPTVPALAIKANAADVTTALAIKANLSDVTTALAAKANASDVTTSLNLKANTSDVASALAIKANNADVTTALATKANSSSLSTVATSGDYNDLSNIPATPSAYSLPIASASVLGGIKVGSNLNLDVNGFLSANINAGSISGTVALSKGGTGQTTIAGIQSILGLAGTKVAIGESSGVSQGSQAVAVGGAAGSSGQGANAVAIGIVAGQLNQGANSVAIGSNAAQAFQGTNAVAIGFAAGQTSQATNSVAIGGYSASTYANSTAIGYQAATTAINTIQLGADGVTIPTSTAITNVKTSGTLTAGTVTYPNAHNSISGQVLTINAGGTASWSSTSSGSNGTHTIGESYGGGVVFYVWDGGAHGLIAASANLTGKYWGADGTLVSSSVYPLRDGIGAGRNNTERIIQNIKSSDILFKSDYTLYAAYACLTFQDGNYGDWYLPSKYELSLLYLQKTLLGMSGLYWSSNDGATRDAWCHNFDAGTTYLNTKNYFTMNVRPIRSF